MQLLKPKQYSSRFIGVEKTMFANTAMYEVSRVAVLLTLEHEAKPEAAVTRFLNAKYYWRSWTQSLQTD
jgi:hypothetical protein